MAESKEKPDFIVDAHGNVMDVRRNKLARDSTVADQPPPPPNTPPVIYIPLEHKKPPWPKVYSDSSCLGVIAIVALIIIVNLVINLPALIPRPGPAAPAQSFDFTSGKNHLEQGLSFQAAGDEEQAELNFSLALADFNNAIKANPKYGEAYNHRGLVYQAQGKLELAIADADKAVELMPASSGAYNNRGTAYHASGDLDAALANYTQAIKLNSMCGKAYYNRGQIYLARADYAQASADFGEAIDHSSVIFTQSGTLTANKKSLADIYWTFALETELADRPMAYTFRGIAYLYAEKTDQALADIEQALRLRGDLVRAIYCRGSIYLTQGDLERAAADFNRVVELDNDPEITRLAQEMLAMIGLK